MKRFQEERWALLYATQFDSISAAPASLALHLETFVFIWMRLRTALRELIELLPNVSELLKLQQTGAQMDAALGLDAGLPPKPLLWEHGGKPFLPHSLPQIETSTELYSLCTLTRLSDGGFHGEHAVVSAAVAATRAAAAAAAANSGDEEAEMMMMDVDGADSTANLPIEIAAKLASDVKLRRELLEGMCLFEIGLQLQQQQQEDDGGGGQVEVLEELVSAFKREAAAHAFERNDSLSIFDIASGAETRATTHRLTMPPTAMVHSTGREMHRHLVAWLDLHCSKQQLMTQSHVLSLLQNNSSVAVLNTAQLNAVAQSVAASGCRDVSEGVPYCVLLWLVDAERNGGGGSDALRDNSLEWRQRLQQALAHEAWFKWHQALWNGAASAPPAFSIKSPLQAGEWWRNVCGPMRLHMSTLTAHALALTGSPRVSISDRGLKVLQLQLAGRHLRNVAAAAASTGLQHHANISAAEARTALLVFVATIESHSAELPVEQAAGVAVVLQRLAEVSSPAALHSEAAHSMHVLNTAVEQSSHRILRQVWPLALQPALQLFLSHPDTITSQTNQGAHASS